MMLPAPEPSLVDTIAQFRARGYDADFSIVQGRLQCGRCDDSHGAADAEIVAVARFEGMSDPDDEAALFALHCPHCGARGVLITAYGPAVDADTGAVLTALRTQPPTQERG